MKGKGIHLGRYPLVSLSAFVLVAIGLVLLSQAAAFGQASDMPNLYRIKGKVIAEGKNNNPVGHLKLKTYRVEEIRLPKPMYVDINGRNLEVDRAFRVTISGGPFPVRDLPAVLWIDGTPLKYGQESEDLSEVTAITFDRALLRDGATIALSYGEVEDARTTLPEKLRLGGSR